MYLFQSSSPSYAFDDVIVKAVKTTVVYDAGGDDLSHIIIIIVLVLVYSNTIPNFVVSL